MQGWDAGTHSPRSFKAWPSPRAPSMRASIAVMSCSKVMSPLVINVAPYLIRTRESGKVRREIIRRSVVIDKHTQIQIHTQFNDVDFLCGEWVGPAG